MAQPLYTMPPMPPHLKYKPTISTYMEHYRRPVQIRRRTKQSFLPKSFEIMMEKQRQEAAMRKAPPLTMSVSKVLRHRPQEPANVCANGSSVTGLAAYDAKTDAPYKPTANTAECHTEYINKIAGNGVKVDDTKARDEARKDRSVNFYDKTRGNSAPTAKLNDENKQKSTDALAHWLTWNTGTLEEPGLQRRLHRPYPTPEPPVNGARSKSAPVQKPMITTEEYRKATTKPEPAQHHWITWNTGNLAPPGVQTRLHRPYPTPEPPVAREPYTSSRNFRPVSCCLEHKVNEKPLSPGTRDVPFNTSHPMPYFV